MDTKNSTAPLAHPSTEDHPHACYEGLVYLTYTTHDDEVGEEVEFEEVLPCRRCAEERS
ncbi:MAG: hypothetical protein ACRDTR_15205 [Rubrobacter sp.]